MDHPVETQTSTGKEWHPRPLGKLWPLLKYSLYTYLIFEVLFIISAIGDIAYTDGAFYDWFATDESYFTAELLLGFFLIFVGIGYGLIFLTCVIAYARFFHRAMKNLYAQNVPGLTVKPAFTWGWFFIPFANLLMPYRAASQVYQGSLDPNHTAEQAPETALRWWWGLWLLGNILGNISFRMNMGSGAFDEITNVDMYLAAAKIDIFTSLMSFPTILLLLGFTKKIYEAQMKNFGDIIFDKPMISTYIIPITRNDSPCPFCPNLTFTMKQPLSRMLRVLSGRASLTARTVVAQNASMN